MRLDYHLHLAPDGEPIGDEQHSVEQLRRYVAQAAARGVEEIGLSEHVYRFREAAELFGHEVWHEAAVGSLDDYNALLEEGRGDGLPLLAALEVDWFPEKDEAIAAVVAGHDWDYLLGSVHWLGDLAVDHPDYPVWAEASVDDVWEAYFEALGAAAASGLFDVMAHPDLAKVFGHRASAPLRTALYERVAEVFAAAEVCAEVSSAGLRKAAAELYPAAPFLTTLQRAGVPITLGSDAHVVGDVGRDLDRAVAAAYDSGYRTITQFRSRDRRQVALG